MRPFLITIERRGMRTHSFEALAPDLQVARRQHACLAGPGERLLVREKSTRDHARFMQECRALQRRRES